MSLAEFVPAPHRKGGSVKPRAVPEGGAFEPADTVAVTVTARRPGRVGSPARSGPRPPAQDPVVIEGALAGLQMLSRLERRATDVARDLRWRQVAAGRAGLVELIAGVQSLVSLTTAILDRGDGLRLSDAAGDTAGDTTRRSIHALITNQTTDDWPALADTVQRQLLPALRRWRPVLEAILGSHREPDPYGWAA